MKWNTITLFLPKGCSVFLIIELNVALNLPNNCIIIALEVSICLDVISSESLDLDSLKKDISTVWKRTSRQFEKGHLNSRDFLDSSKTKSRQSTMSRSLSRLSILTFQSRHLDCRENLDSLKKDISTLRTFLMSISIGLDCRDPQAYIIIIINYQYSSLVSLLKLNVTKRMLDIWLNHTNYDGTVLPCSICKLIWVMFDKIASGCFLSRSDWRSMTRPKWKITENTSQAETNRLKKLKHTWATYKLRKSKPKYLKTITVRNTFIVTA